MAAPLPDVPWTGGPFRWRLGLRPLDPARWLETGVDHPDHAEQMAAKAAVLADHHDTAVVVADDVEDEAREVLAAIVDHLDRHARRSHGVPASRPDPTLHPLDTAGRLVQEDLVLLVERDGHLVVGGGSVCFPNRWDLRSKLGRTMAEVHEPVPYLNEQLAGPIDKVLSRLRPELGFWRLGWGILDTPEPYQALDGTAHRSAVAREDLGLHDMWVRVERETLRRFPSTGAVLFTIRTRIAPLASLLVDPALADELADAVAAVPDAVARYKELHDVGDRIVGWMRPGCAGAEAIPSDRSGSREPDPQDRSSRSRPGTCL